MVRQEVVLEALLSSPSDQAEERQLIAEMIAQQNKMWTNSQGVRVELLRWETDVVPGVGASAQEVINEGVGDEYDVFIGILGARFGTRTRVADSGTEEEFDRAYQRFKSTGRPRILIYFSQKPVAPSSLDPEQLAKVGAFKQRLESSGVFYRDFRTNEELEQLARLHLDKIVTQWKQESSDPAQQQAENMAAKLPSEQEEAEEEGLLDLLETAFDKSAEFQEVMERMTEATLEVGERINRRSAQIEKVGEVADRLTLKQAKTALLGAATDLSMFSKRLEDDTPLFASSYREIVEAYAKMLSILRELPHPENEEQVTEESIEQIGEMLTTIRTSAKSIEEFRGAMQNWPSMSAQLNRGRRRASAALADLISQFSTAENLTSELLRSYTAFRSEELEANGT